MTKFSNSGLYKQPFYKKVSDLVYDQDFLLDTLCVAACFRNESGSLSSVRTGSN